MADTDKVDYHIEFAHIYSDEVGISKEQMDSIRHTKRFIRELKKRKKTYTLSLLIDEYHPKHTRLNLDKFLADMEKHGVAPTYVIYESKLITPAKMLIKAIGADYKKHEKFHPKINVSEEVLLIDTNEGPIDIEVKGDVIHLSRYTCALLNTSFILLRLGVVSAKDAVEYTGLTEPKPFAATYAVNIESKKYAPIEEASRAIILASKYRACSRYFKVIFSDEKTFGGANPYSVMYGGSS